MRSVYGARAGLSAASHLTATTTLRALAISRRFQSNFNDGGLDNELDAMFGQPQSDAGSFLRNSGSDNTQDVWSTAPPTAGSGSRQQPPLQEMSSIIRFQKINKVPAKFDVMTFSNCFVWNTNAAIARKIIGPMREWADEVKYRTGVHLEMDPLYPNKIAQKLYKTSDEVEMNIYAFGSDRSVIQTAKLMESMIHQEPAYVRLGVFRRIPDSPEVEWITLRRINRELRPPDIPPISLKLPGKHTMLFENFKEAAIRSCWEETGIAVDPKLVYPSGMLDSKDPDYYWRVPVRYFVAELPAGADIRGPLPSEVNYMQAWDSRLLRQSPDPIDQAWAKHADAATGTAWLKSSQLDVLQKPLRGDHYMSIRYTPPPFSELQTVVNLPPLPE